jgi:hypothetical protein
MPVHPAHLHPPDVDASGRRPVRFVAMRRDIVIGIVIVVVLETARMRPGG